MKASTSEWLAHMQKFSGPTKAEIKAIERKAKVKFLAQEKDGTLNKNGIVRVEVPSPKPFYKGDFSVQIVVDEDMTFINVFSEKNNKAGAGLILKGNSPAQLFIPETDFYVLCNTNKIILPITAN